MTCQAALTELIGEELAGQLPKPPPEGKPAQVINLMEALKRSPAERRMKSDDRSRAGWPFLSRQTSVRCR